MVRSALKEPHKSKTLGRDASFIKISKWGDGKVTKVGKSDVWTSVY